MKKENLKTTRPIIFCNIGWCTFYDAREDDQLIGGGSHVRKYKTGNEHLNFIPFRVCWDDTGEEEDLFLGSYETKSHNGIANQTHLEHIIGCSAHRNDTVASGVTVVWCALNPAGKTCVVGWYDNANVFRRYQSMIIDDDNEQTWDRVYNISCKYQDAVLLPLEERTDEKWEIPRHTQNSKTPYGFGQSNIWYASKPEASELVKRIIAQIDAYDGIDIKSLLTDVM